MMARTLYDKIWDAHTVKSYPDGTDLIYIDRHLVHEVTSPQAFEGIELAGRRVRRPDLTTATTDHNVPTDGGAVRDAMALAQLTALETNCERHGIKLHGIGSATRGIVHVMGPELGLTLPGTTVVCGDSHTSTHGAFGALGLGIGTTEVEHVLATQTLQLRRARNFRVRFDGRPPEGVTPKDMIMAFIGRIGTSGGTGCVIEYTGEAVSALTMEGRMTICSMTIEAGARAGLIAPDGTTFAYFRKPRPEAPQGSVLERAIKSWRGLSSDADSAFVREETMDVSKLAPQVTWGTNPAMTISINEPVPEPGDARHVTPEDARRALDYMGLKPGMSLIGLGVDVVFIGSCTNGRIEDLRASAGVLRGRRVHPKVRLLVVPGSESVRREAEREGLHTMFMEAGGEWRGPGCSMCLAMNEDRLRPGERCASTSNRNFEGRQGPGGRTHLVSPVMAAATAVAGHIVDVRGFA